jgi:hypothetical protein
MSDKYKPSGIVLLHYVIFICNYPLIEGLQENDGLRQDGQPDKRTQQTEFAYGKVDPQDAGQQGGSTTGSGSTSEGKVTGGSGSGSGGFAHGKVDPHEAGRKGGQQ